MLTMATTTARTARTAARLASSTKLGAQPLNVVRTLSSARFEGGERASTTNAAAAAGMLFLGGAVGSSMTTHMEGADMGGEGDRLGQQQTTMLATAPFFKKRGKKAPRPETITALPHPDVTIWIKDGRTIYLVGALNYAATSADLASLLIKQVNPDAVFLDINKENFTELGIAERAERRLEVKRGKIWKDVSEMSEPIEALPDIIDTSNSKKKGGIPVETSITGIFGQMRFAGLKKGDEQVASWTHYVSAVESAKQTKADIILGGRDAEIAHKRREEALSKTDKKAAADLVFAVRPNWDKTLSPRENLTTVRKLMEREVPTFSQVVFAETDEHNALNLDKMWQPMVVAVFMMIHMVGVEQELKKKGWKQVLW